MRLVSSISCRDGQSNKICLKYKKILELYLLQIRESKATMKTSSRCCDEISLIAGCDEFSTIRPSAAWLAPWGVKLPPSKKQALQRDFFYFSL